MLGNSQILKWHNCGIIFLFPFYRKANIVSIYEFLEMRFGVGTRLLLSILFQFLRAFSTGVTVFGISLVISKCVSLPFVWCVILLAAITIVYDSIGGMKAVVASDVIQMAVLFLGVVLIGVYAIHLMGGIGGIMENADRARLVPIDFSGHGLGDGKTFAFWPMLLGGLFLYVSYYGCDQTQVQRELSSSGIDDSRRSLFMNGILRFPLVLSYCFIGVAIGAFAIKNPQFLELLPLKADGTREVNLAVPTFVIEYLPHGIIGLIMVALFAAAMSSLDSTINSLSAMTVRDVERFTKKPISDKTKLLWSKGTTVFWGVVCTLFSFKVGDIAPSIIESVNKIGSLINGPVLATFLLAILTRRATGHGAVTGILVGVLVNRYFWVNVPSVSWLWWNVIGCVITFGIGYAVSLAFSPPVKKQLDGLTFTADAAKNALAIDRWKSRYIILGAYFVIILIVLILIKGLAL